MSRGVFLMVLVLTGTSLQLMAQAQEVTRVEFNSGTRMYREQLIVTADSVIVVQENFQNDEKPRVVRRAIKGKEWNDIRDALKNIPLREVPSLQAPTNKRTYDAAAHGSLIISTRNNRTVTHAFDNEDPHETLQPLMKTIRRIAGGKSKRPGE
jgi:hypothetical protein